MIPGLSRRLGQALGTRDVTADERATVVSAADAAESWADLPVAVQTLVEEIEQRPPTWDDTTPAPPAA